MPRLWSLLSCTGGGVGRRREGGRGRGTAKRQPMLDACTHALWNSLVRRGRVRPRIDPNIKQVAIIGLKRWRCYLQDSSDERKQCSKSLGDYL